MLLSQTVQVMDKSGQVVGTSKHLFSVFKEAKAAYRERKAEILANREVQAREAELRKPRRVYTIADSASQASSRRPSHSRLDHEHRTPRESFNRHQTSPKQWTSALAAEPKSPLRRTQTAPVSPAIPPPPQYYTASSPYEHPAQNAAQEADLQLAPPLPQRRYSEQSDIDMDLAYGELPADFRHRALGVNEEVELSGLVRRCKALLDEAHCLQHTATATIAHLQKNPDAMAAVALTLAEISNLVKKMSPAMLLGLKSAAPAVFALLASPQFLIAAGVGVGVTIIMFGGYKIIKRIQERRAEEANDAAALEGMDAMLSVEDISRVDSWRRGIADVEAGSAGCSVDGEFITPMAASWSRLNLAEQEAGRPRLPMRHSSGSRTAVDSMRSDKMARGKGSEKRGKGKEVKKKKEKNDKEEKKERERKEKMERKEAGKDKKPSPLRKMLLS